MGRRGRGRAALPARRNWCSIAGTVKKALSLVASCLFALLGARTARAESSQFQVSTSTSGSYYYSVPAVAADAAGRFTVVWDVDAYESGDTIVGRRYDRAAVSAGPVFEVSTYPGGARQLPRIGSNRAGAFVVVWEGDGLGDYAGVFGRRYDADGVAQGDEFRVNGYAPGAQEKPDVAVGPAGDFIVVWRGQLEGVPGVFGRRFDASGASQGDDFRVSTSTSAGQFQPAIGADDAGRFVVVWELVGRTVAVMGRRLTATGEPAADDFVVSMPPGNGFAPGLAVTRAGPFVVAWYANGRSVSTQILAQRFDASGVRVGAEILVAEVPLVTPNPTETPKQVPPQVATDRGGNFVVAWQQNPTPDCCSVTTDVLARRFSADGTPLGDAFTVNTTPSGFETGTHRRPAVAMSDPGDLVVAWHQLVPIEETAYIVARQLVQCGNGVVEPGEECDDGNLVDGDCCSSTCASEDHTCDDTDVCTETDRCQEGRCEGRTLACDDANVCTVDSCTPTIGCEHRRVCGALLPPSNVIEFPRPKQPVEITCLGTAGLTCKIVLREIVGGATVAPRLVPSEPRVSHRGARRLSKRARGTLGADGTVTIKLRLNALGRRLLRRSGGQVPVTVETIIGRERTPLLRELAKLIRRRR